jgi:hypothetical protein
MRKKENPGSATWAQKQEKGGAFSAPPFWFPKTNKRKQKGSFWSGTRDELRNGPTSCFLPVIIKNFTAICTFCVFFV